MKAIATLAVLGLAYAGERRENPRFRIDSKVVTANNNKDVLNIDLSKDIPNMSGVKTSVVTKDLKDLIPAGLRDLVKDVKVDHRVFTAQNNNGVININMDDADDEFIGVTWKHKDINGDHNSGRMDININNDDADNELMRFRDIDSRTGQIYWTEFPEVRRNDDADHELIGVTWRHKDINGDHNSGRMDININNDDADNELLSFPKPRPGERDYLRDLRQDLVRRTVADDELVYIPGKQWGPGLHIMDDADNELRTTVHANDNNGMMQIMGRDDEFFLDLTNKHTHVNANHNSGMMNIRVNNDDADNELASWNTENIYFPKRQGGPDYVHVKTENQVNSFAGNTGVRIIQRDDADDELVYIPGKQLTQGFYHIMDDADNELRSTTKIHANDNNGMINIMGHDDELFLDFTNKHNHVNANHNSGMMNININNDDADDELLQLGALLKSFKGKKPTDTN